jgi:hypothetical protein
VLENEDRLELEDYKSSYNISFNNCTIRNSRIENSDITIFRNCDIDILKIIFKQPKQLVFFDNCKIRELKLLSSKNTSVVVFNLVDFINKVDSEGFGGKLYSVEKINDKHNYKKVERIEDSFQLLI